MEVDAEGTGEPHRETVYLVADGGAADPDPGRPAAGRLRPLSREGVPRRRRPRLGDDLPGRAREARGRRPLPRRSGERRWREERLEAKGNDRFEATLSPDALGPWELRVQAWVDPYASWLDEHDRKVAGRPVGPGRRALRGRAAVRRRRRRRLARRRGASLRPQAPRCHARAPCCGSTSIASAPASAPGTSSSRARGAASAASRRCCPSSRPSASTSSTCPPVHPIGETFRKGRNNSERAKKGDPGSPWAIGAAAGGHDALHPDLGSDEDFDAMVAAARDGGTRDRARLRDPVLPDHPWLKEHPAWFNRRPDGTIKYAENPPKRYQDIHNVDWDSEERERALAGASRRRARLVRPRGPRLPRRQPAHQADAVLGVADRRGAQPVPGGDLPRRGVHAPGADDDAREDRLLAVLYVLHVEEHEGGARRVRRAGALVVGATTGRTCGRTRRTSCTSTCRRAVAPAFEARLVLAATLSPSYGIYSGYEALENTPLRPGAARSTSTRRSTR